MTNPERGGENDDRDDRDDHQDDQPDEGDILVESLQRGLVIRVYGDEERWIYSDEPVTLEEQR